MNTAPYKQDAIETKAIVFSALGAVVAGGLVILATPIAVPAIAIATGTVAIPFATTAISAGLIGASAVAGAGLGYVGTKYVAPMLNKWEVSKIKPVKGINPDHVDDESNKESRGRKIDEDFQTAGTDRKKILAVIDHYRKNAVKNFIDSKKTDNKKIIGIFASTDFDYNSLFGNLEGIRVQVETIKHDIKANASFSPESYPKIPNEEPLQDEELNHRIEFFKGFAKAIAQSSISQDEKTYLLKDFVEWFEYMCDENYHHKEHVKKFLKDHFDLSKMDPDNYFKSQAKYFISNRKLSDSKKDFDQEDVIIPTLTEVEQSFSRENTKVIERHKLPPVPKDKGIEEEKKATELSQLSARRISSISTVLLNDFDKSRITPNSNYTFASSAKNIEDKIDELFGKANTSEKFLDLVDQLVEKSIYSISNGSLSSAEKTTKIKEILECATLNFDYNNESNEMTLEDFDRQKTEVINKIKQKNENFVLDQSFVERNSFTESDLVKRLTVYREVISNILDCKDEEIKTRATKIYTIQHRHTGLESHRCVLQMQKKDNNELFISYVSHESDKVDSETRLREQYKKLADEFFEIAKSCSEQDSFSKVHFVTDDLLNEYKKDYQLPLNKTREEKLKHLFELANTEEKFFDLVDKLREKSIMGILYADVSFEEKKQRIEKIFEDTNPVAYEHGTTSYSNYTHSKREEISPKRKEEIRKAILNNLDFCHKKGDLPQRTKFTKEYLLKRLSLFETMINCFLNKEDLTENEKVSILKKFVEQHEIGGKEKFNKTFNFYKRSASASSPSSYQDIANSYILRFEGKKFDSEEPLFFDDSLHNIYKRDLARLAPKKNQPSPDIAPIGDPKTRRRVTFAEIL